MNKEQAIKVVNHVSKVFLIVGAIQIFGGLAFVGFSPESKIVMGITGAVYIVMGFLLGKFKKPIIAIILLLLSIAGVLITGMNLFGILGNTQNRGLPIVGIAMAIASFQAIKATRKYQEK